MEIQEARVFNGSLEHLGQMSRADAQLAPGNVASISGENTGVAIWVIYRGPTTPAVLIRTVVSSEQEAIVSSLNGFQSTVLGTNLARA